MIVNCLQFKNTSIFYARLQGRLNGNGGHQDNVIFELQQIIKRDYEDELFIILIDFKSNGRLIISTHMGLKDELIKYL